MGKRRLGSAQAKNFVNLIALDAKFQQGLTHQTAVAQQENAPLGAVKGTGLIHDDRVGDLEC
jgi:hypothetical protein